MMREWFISGIWDNMRQNETKWDNMRQNETIWNNMRQYETIWDNMRKYDPAPIRGSCRHPGVRFATSNARTEETSDARTERKSYLRQQCNAMQYFTIAQYSQRGIIFNARTVQRKSYLMRQCNAILHNSPMLHNTT